MHAHRHVGAAMRGRALQAAIQSPNKAMALHEYTYGGCPVPRLSYAVLGGELPAVGQF